MSAHTDVPPTAATARVADPARFLRGALRLDATVSGLAGLLFLATGTGLVPELTGIPATVHAVLGPVLLIFAAGVALVGSRPSPRPAAVWTVIAINVSYVAAGIAALAAGLWPLTGLGVALMLAQSVAVAVFAGLEYIGLRRMGR